jgi:3-methylcrotonyl-CoA carboxylase alpha subunit
MFRSVLVANRGEIACRVFRTAKRMGLRTIAVYSEADANALHVREADEAVLIGPAPARESYLDQARVLAAAKATGAEAIHPGYGFLSENAEFAEAVMAAGLTWIGAPPASIRAMGLKDAAKQLMVEAGVPVTPGYMGEDQSPDRLKAEADAIGYPVLIKAVAGGGGKGMRRVDEAPAFLDALASCQREAASSFGDDRVLIEKYILSPRHIEVQVFGDSHGEVVHLFERDCSLQRRHQKVIEEAPAPGMDEATRQAVTAAAVRAARAVNYVGAGTIEFIADGTEGLRADRIWFMEMNTRLQVEHPVTEMITGQDLVEWQLRVAAGEPLPLKQDQLSITGWAMEARLYAEDPANGFLPSIGRLEHFILPSKRSAAGEGDREAVEGAATHSVRVDTGVEAGGEVSQFYDPMIAKLIVHEDTREAAAARLAEACAEVQVWPVRTNAGFLVRCLEHPRFVAGDVDTGFIGAEEAALTDARPSDAVIQDASDLLWRSRNVDPNDVWDAEYGAPGFRLNAARVTRQTFFVDGVRHQAPHENNHPVVRYGPQIDGGFVVFHGGDAYAVSRHAPRGAGGGGASDGSLRAPMPGKIVAAPARPGDAVTKGQPIVVLEAMKMEHALVAPFDGVVGEIGVSVGDQVAADAVLARVEAASA